MSSSTTATATTSAATGPLAVVTGATGYIAGHVIDQLIRKGYRVRGTVRSINDPKSVQLRKDFPSLELLEADLMKDNSFDAAIAGVRFVFHVASPAKLDAEDGQRDLVDPAVKGTANVVSTALRTPTVQRIVLTSSIITALSPAAPAGKVYSDEDWNNDWQVQQAPYQVSKVQAERKAWELVNAHNAANASHPVRLITILPSSVLGPPIGSRVDGYSVNILTDLLNGSLVSSGVKPLNFTDVDVRDVAAAHVAAAEVESASGRYIVSNRTPATPLDYVKILRPLFPNRQLPSTQAAPWIFKPYTADNSKSVKQLGIRYRDQEQSVKDMVDKLIEIGLVTRD
jgi:nucleoside-diphosphate-sugar epimerase